ncbi:aspartyl-phosphate phosphatase Spo0E family protein, partial [Paenibacillus glucanolyticus]
MKREIERARIELYELVEEFNLTDPIVLLKSKELDELLNQYD